MAWIGAAIAAAGSLIGGSQANRAQEDASQRSMEWQERMRATAYQTTVDDLQKAGLSPMLAYGQGSTHTPSAPQKPDIKDAITPAVTSALQARQMQGQLELLSAQAEQARAGARNQDSQAAVNAVQVPHIVAQTQTQGATAYQQQSQGALNSVSYNRVLEEIENLRMQRGLTQQQTINLREDLMNVMLRGGEISARTKELLSRSRGNTAHAILAELAQARARNESRAEESWWKENISPYLRDVQSITGSAGAVRRNFGSRNYSREFNDNRGYSSYESGSR